MAAGNPSGGAVRLSRTFMPVWAAILFIACLSGATAAEWRVAKVSGDVFIQQGAVHLASLSNGVSLGAGAVVVTQGNGRAQLVRGQQTMIVSPNSVVTLPADRGRVTTILQTVGQVEFHVDSRQVQHFTVETPYLAAAVKGTRFVVNVRRGRASVGVYRGRVEVTNLKSGDRADVLPGQRGAVGARKGISIRGKGDIQAVRPGLARAAMVAAATAKDVLASLSQGAVASAGKSAAAQGKANGKSGNNGKGNGNGNGHGGGNGSGNGNGGGNGNGNGRN
ncbi:MAG: FecR family protein [Alphaproteobacteria bacterium]|nr:FecR family protein [Alphaproteobacteria bacterium]